MSTSNCLKRKARFPTEESELATVVCTLVNREDLAEEDHSALWFARSDFFFSRSAAKVVSQESQRFGYSKNLDGVFGEKSKESQERLNLWAAHGHSRRGLERWANRDLGEKRQQAQFKAIMAVIHAQYDMLAESTNEERIDDEQLRKVSVKASKIARHFARMMGKADAYALTYSTTATTIPEQEVAIPAAENEFMRKACTPTPATIEEAGEISRLRSGLRKLHLGTKSDLTKKEVTTSFRKKGTNARIPRIA